MYCDPETRAYVERRTKDGKSKKAIMRVVVAGGVVGADLGVDGAFGEHVPDDDQHRVGNGHQCALLATSFRDLPEPDGEIVVLGSNCGSACFDER